MSRSICLITRNFGNGTSIARKAVPVFSFLRAGLSPGGRSMNGKIVKEDGRYVLKASDHKTYQIDDQEKAKQFEGKQVKIVGSLDMSTGTIRIQSIEPAS